MPRQQPPIPVLFVHHRSELGGAPESLSYVIRELDRDRFEPHVYCPPGPAADLFREAGAIVHTGAVAGFTHIWASSYRGPPHIVFGHNAMEAPQLHAWATGIDTACVGKGTCGLCRVRIKAGAENLNPYTDEETKHLGNVYHITKVRLSCRTKPTGDVTIEIVRKRKPRS